MQLPANPQSMSVNTVIDALRSAIESNTTISDSSKVSSKAFRPPFAAVRQVHDPLIDLLVNIAHDEEGPGAISQQGCTVRQSTS